MPLAAQGMLGNVPHRRAAAVFRPQRGAAVYNVPALTRAGSAVPRYLLLTRVSHEAIEPDRLCRPRPGTRGPVRTAALERARAGRRRQGNAGGPRGPRPLRRA